jgi:asparagine synthase (glutamine-hydrolysing)
VRSAVLRAVRACRSDAVKPLLLLLGGLDSSVLAASLAALRGGFACVNFVRDSGAGDERLFARAVADRVGATLIEAEWRLADVDVTHCHLPGLPDPVARSFMQGTNSLLAGAASAAGADVTIDGGGGDNVFFGLRSVAPVTDALLHGETLAAGWKTAASVARLAQTSFTRCSPRRFCAVCAPRRAIGHASISNCSRRPPALARRYYHPTHGWSRRRARAPVRRPMSRWSPPRRAGPKRAISSVPCVMPHR